MADIFISYSKADRDKVVMLAAYLESEGWTVWWDTNLEVGRPYRDDIMRELVAARAVLVLWTQTSIKSDFVRAEAGRAKADGKLIPVKESDVAHGDIPLPFGEMHTEDLSKRELVRAAVVAQLAKPALSQGEFIETIRSTRYLLLVWIGAVGGALTIFSNLQSLLVLADWARAIVVHWREWAHFLWAWVGGLVGISVPQRIVPALTFLLFLVTLVASGGQSLYTSLSETRAFLKRMLKPEPTADQTISNDNIHDWLLRSVYFFCVISFALRLARVDWAYIMIVLYIVGVSLVLLVLNLLITEREARSPSTLCGLAMMFIAVFVGSTAKSTLIELIAFIVAQILILQAMNFAASLKKLATMFGVFAALVILNELSKYGPLLRELAKPPL